MDGSLRRERLATAIRAGVGLIYPFPLPRPTWLPVGLFLPPEALLLLAGKQLTTHINVRL